MIDDDTFKRGKLFHGHPVLGTISDLEEIFLRTSFDEILIAQDDLRGLRLNSFKIVHGAPRIERAPVIARRDRYQRAAPYPTSKPAAVAFGAAALALKVPTSLRSSLPIASGRQAPCRRLA